MIVQRACASINTKQNDKKHKINTTGALRNQAIHVLDSAKEGVVLRQGGGGVKASPTNMNGKEAGGSKASPRNINYIFRMLIGGKT